MTARRDFLKYAGAVVLGLGGVGKAAAAAELPGEAHATRRSRVRGLHRREDTIVRLGGVGDGFKMTWAGDRQYLVVNDGFGWEEHPTAFYNSQLWTLAGSAAHAEFSPVNGYPDLSDAVRPETVPRYFGQGIVAARGALYQFLSTLDRDVDRPRHWTGAKLICSLDHGRTWRNQDGTTPVTWEDWGKQSREHLVFFGEPNGCFSLLSVLQMGRDYSANRDGYFYVYGLNGSIDGQMNELVMFRAPIEQLLSRRAYEFFAGRRRDGTASWTRDIAARAVVHTFPRGWVNRTNLFPDDLVVESWLPSVAYVEALGLYVMTSAGVGCAPDGTAAGKPSYLGFWVSDAPWGPWRQVHEDTRWTPGGDLAARAYAPQLSPAWISADGRSLWLVWADLQGIREFARDRAILDERLKKAGSSEESAAVMADFTRRYLPRYSFNAQRFDVDLS